MANASDIMSLLFRINAALGAVFLIAALFAGYVCWNMLQANAQREVLRCAFTRPMRFCR
jgi:hypothetical protein